MNRRARLLAGATAVVLLLSGCSLVDGATGADRTPTTSVSPQSPPPGSESLAACCG